MVAVATNKPVIILDLAMDDSSNDVIDVEVQIYSQNSVKLDI